MTYSCGLLVKDGLAMIADARTNSGVDNVSMFRKLQVFQTPDRVLAIATAGNLSVAQSEPDGPYFRDLGERSSATLRVAVADMPAPPYKDIP